MTLLEKLLSIFGIIKIHLKFDLNKCLEERRKIKLKKIENICPHTTLSKEKNQIMLDSLFISPPGTNLWKCSQCGKIIDSKDTVEKIINFYQDKNIKLLYKKQKNFKKQARKLGLL